MLRPALVQPFTLASVSLLLVACGGGSGSSGPGSRFISWSDVTPPQTVVVKGLSAESTYEAPDPDNLVTEIGPTEESQSSTAKLTYDADGNLTRVIISTPYSTVSWDKNSSDLIEIEGGIIGLGNNAGTNLGIVADPLTQGWDYQTFGTWITGIGTESGRAGAISVGAPTESKRIPAKGTATFTGPALGTYVDSGGEAYSTVGDMTIDADFSDQSLDFTVINTQKLNLNTLVDSDAGHLNLTGTLNYQPGTSSFSGDVSAAALEGVAKGQFYGPEAEEIGGYFDLIGLGVETYRGAFGGARGAIDP